MNEDALAMHEFMALQIHFLDASTARRRQRWFRRVQAHRADWLSNSQPPALHLTRLDALPHTAPRRRPSYIATSLVQALAYKDNIETALSTFLIRSRYQLLLRPFSKSQGFYIPSATSTMPGAIARKARISKKKPERLQAQINALSSFARVSKAKAVEKETTTTKVIRLESIPADAPQPAHEPSRKRKATSPALDTDNADLFSQSDAVSRTIVTVNKRQRRAAEVKGKSNAASADQAQLLLQKLGLQSPRQTQIVRIDARITQPTTGLTLALQDILDLHTALLKTLTLQVAHSGRNVPIDLRELCPGIAQVWGKRSVTTDDICLCLGILEMKNQELNCDNGIGCPFFLIDYGRGKICIELHEEAQQSTINDAQLGRDFEAVLRSLYTKHQSQNDDTVDSFIAGLPRAAIKQSRTAVLPKLVKARHTFEELTNGVIRKQQAKEHRGKLASSLNPDGTTMSLVDRIRHKESLQDQAAKPPTPEELQRRSALHRVEDVAAVLAMLVTSTAMGQGRVAFSMAMIQQRLKDSLRVPIGKEEGAVCVRLLAKEVAPQWVRVVTVGGRENVVIQPAFQPVKGAVEERAKLLLG
jgi:hypothetical protein